MFRWAKASSNDDYYWQPGIDQSSVRAASYQWATYYWARVINFLFSLVGFPQVFPLSPLFHLEISETFFFSICIFLHPTALAFILSAVEYFEKKRKKMLMTRPYIVPSQLTET